MRRSLIPFVTTLLLLAGAGLAMAEPIPAKTSLEVMAQVQAWRDATLSGDYSKVAMLMHPRVVEKFGGVEPTADLVRQMMERMEAAGLRFDRFDVDPPSEIVYSQYAEHVFLPTTAVVLSMDKEIHRHGWLLASRPKDTGGDWVFIDGAGVEDTSSLAVLFPGFPGDASIPDKHEEVMQR